jgi:hypothetical protein
MLVIQRWNRIEMGGVGKGVENRQRNGNAE